MVIVSDFDGVPVDHMAAACKVWNLKHKPMHLSDITPEMAYNYGFRTKDGRELCPGIDHKELFRDPLFFEVLQPMEGAVEVYERMAKKHRLIFLTSGTFGNIGLKAPWIHEHFPFVDEAIFVKTKDKTDKSFFKGDFMRDAVFIDDTAGCLDSVGAKYSICYGQIKGWNSQWQGVRSYNMSELEAEINYIDWLEGLHK